MEPTGWSLSSGAHGYWRREDRDTHGETPGQARTVRTGPCGFRGSQGGLRCTHVIPANSPGGQRVLDPGTVSLTLFGDRLSLQAEQVTWGESGSGEAG